MIYTIAAIQRLDLRFCVDAINASNAWLLSKSTQILQQITDQRDHHYALAHELQTPNSILTHNMLCTWRPTYCLDMFLYFGPDHTITVGLPMQSDTPPQHVLGHCWRRCCETDGANHLDRLIYDPDQNGKRDITSGNEKLSEALQHQTIFTENEWLSFGIVKLDENDYIRSGSACFVPDMHNAPHVEIKYFSSEMDINTQPIPECVCFAHLTCDTDDDDNHTMVALVYDILINQDRTDDTPSTTQQRYEYLRSMSELLSTVIIGEACVRVQWAGDPCMYDQLQSLGLPHAHDKIVFYGNHHRYFQFAFDRVAPV